MNKRNSYMIEVDGKQIELTIDRAYCIGYTGRNKEKTLEHVKELAAIGVPEPEEIPALYPISKSNLNQQGEIEVVGHQTSGEAEVVLIFGENDKEIFLTVGSDHTDRSLETVDINKSKQVCDKPFAKEAWKLSAVINHWDELELASDIFIDGKWEPYQKEKISKIIAFEEILEYLKKKRVSMKNSIVFAGTVPLKEGFKYGEEFRLSFIDPIRNKAIETSYIINNLA
ncbi:DUF2848 family protein [Thalassobacillus sp. CUG 92003]|uniref:DUF2848 family protein n=1 Tax=Thalassobacillus sp. CUG 92003 TaxID=2736641 RepID=UPI0015E71EF1|nr:DUF2848 family protein [Thalassobacillus sp. CUG 92003]